MTRSSDPQRKVIRKGLHKTSKTRRPTHRKEKVNKGLILKMREKEYKSESCCGEEEGFKARGLGPIVVNPEKLLKGRRKGVR